MNNEHEACGGVDVVIDGGSGGGDLVKDFVNVNFSLHFAPVAP